MKKIQLSKRLISLCVVIILIFSTVPLVSAEEFVLNDYEKSVLASNPSPASTEAIIGHVVEGEAYYLKNVKSGKYATVNQYGELIQTSFSNSLAQKFRVSYEEDTSGAGNHYTISTIDSTRTYTELGTQNYSSNNISLCRYDYINNMQITFDSQTGYYQASRTTNGITYKVQASPISTNNKIFISSTTSEYADWVFEPAVFEEKTYRIKSPYTNCFIEYVEYSSAWGLQIDLNRISEEYDEDGNLITPYDQMFYMEYEQGEVFSIRNHQSTETVDVTLHYEAQYGFYDIRNADGVSLVYSGHDTNVIRQVACEAMNGPLRGWHFVQYGRKEVNSSVLIAMDNINCWSNYHDNGTTDNIYDDIFNYYEESRNWATGYSCWADGIFDETDYYTDYVCIQEIVSGKYVGFDEQDGTLKLFQQKQPLKTIRTGYNEYNIIGVYGEESSVKLESVGTTEHEQATTQYCHIGKISSNSWLQASGEQLNFSGSTAEGSLIFKCVESDDKVKDKIFNAITNNDVVTVASHGAIGKLFIQSLSSKYGYTIPNEMTTYDIEEYLEDSATDFSNCKLLVLFACNSGTNVNGQNETSLGDVFKENGVETVVCFNENLLEVNTNEWASYFYSALSWGLTVTQAKDYAFENVENITETTVGESCCRIIGNANLALM